MEAYLVQTLGGYVEIASEYYPVKSLTSGKILGYATSGTRYGRLEHTAVKELGIEGKEPVKIEINIKIETK